LTEVASEDWEPFCRALKNTARSLPLTRIQQDNLDALRRSIQVPDADARFAVRSSLPEEDLISAFFVGSCETRLGVHPDDLEEALRHCFASNLNLCVLTDKKVYGFDPWLSGMAVIVQYQIDSEIAGVGFSLNPLTHDHDEVAIEANWGPGTSVVKVWSRRTTSSWTRSTERLWMRFRREEGLAVA